MKGPRPAMNTVTWRQWCGLPWPARETVGRGGGGVLPLCPQPTEVVLNKLGLMPVPQTGRQRAQLGDDCPDVCYHPLSSPSNHTRGLCWSSPLHREAQNASGGADVHTVLSSGFDKIKKVMIQDYEPGILSLYPNFLDFCSTLSVSFQKAEGPWGAEGRRMLSKSRCTATNL